jgi:hypothetical protein
MKINYDHGNVDTFPKIQPSGSTQNDAVDDIFSYVIMMSSWERIVLKRIQPYHHLDLTRITIDANSFVGCHLALPVRLCCTMLFFSRFTVQY